MNLESDIDELLYEYPTTVRVHNALQKCEEIKQIKDLINEDGSFVGYFMAIPNIGKKSAMDIDQMRRWFVKNHLTPHQENQIINLESDIEDSPTVTIVLERVNINQLRAQRNKLLEFLNPSDEITGLINLLDYMLDVAEGYAP